MMLAALLRDCLFEPGIIPPIYNQYKRIDQTHNVKGVIE